MYEQPGGLAAHRVASGQRYDLSSPVKEGGSFLFRRTLYINLPINDRVSGLRFAGNASLGLRFEPLDVGVHGAHHAWVEKWQAVADDKTQIKLKLPAAIKRINSIAYGSVSLARMDGEAVAEEASISGSTSRDLPEDFYAAAFEARFSLADMAAISHAKARALERSRQRKGKSLSAALATIDEHIIEQDIELHEVFQAALLDASLTQIDIRGRPSSPRIRLISEAGAGENLWQWIEAGEQTAALSWSAQGADLVSQFQAALDRAMKKRSAGQTHLELALQIESDAPCRVVLTQAQLTVLQETELLAQSASLSFDGTGRGSQSLALQPLLENGGLPKHLLVSASLAFRDLAAANPLPSSDELVSSLGVQIEENAMIAVRIECSQSSWLCGAALAWRPQSEASQLRLSLHDDQGGEPAAPVLMQAELKTEGMGRRWLRFSWPQAPAQPGAYWLKLTVLRGAGIWLGATSASKPLWRQSAEKQRSLGRVPIELYAQTIEPQSASTNGAHHQPLQMLLDGQSLVPLAGHEAASGSVIQLQMLNLASASLSGAAQLEVRCARDANVTVKSVLLSSLT